MSAPPRITIANREVGLDCPTYVICEGGVNWNGAFRHAVALTETAASLGADAIKWQKRTPELHASATKMRESCTAPEGVMVTELEHRTRLEFTASEYRELTWRAAPLDCFASAWDAPSVDWLAAFHPAAWKVASASITDLPLLECIRDEARSTGAAIIMSTGMSTLDEIDAAVDVLGVGQLALLHCVSTYPADPATLNLRCLQTLRERYPACPIGYSGHEPGIAMTTAAVALGACIVERHLTLDRTMRGSDHAASLEPEGMRRLIRDIRAIGFAMGDGVKRLVAGEAEQRARLRRVA